MKYSYEYKKQCVELYRQGRWPETPEGVSKDRFHRAVVEWHRLEKACGTEAMRHKKQNNAIQQLADKYSVSKIVKSESSL